MYCLYDLCGVEIKMNVYDFDKTIYGGDSTIDFYVYCIKKHPKILLCLPSQMMAVCRYKMHKINKTIFKEHFFCFLKKLKDPQSDVVNFWNKNENKIKNWYLKQKKSNDLIISASPQFLLEEICCRIGIVELIASQVDIHNGKFYGENCYGKEKCRRFHECKGNEKIDKFYSDSLSDMPLAEIAESAFLIKKNKINLWEN